MKTFKRHTILVLFLYILFQISVLFAEMGPAETKLKAEAEGAALRRENGRWNYFAVGLGIGLLGFATDKRDTATTCFVGGAATGLLGLIVSSFSSPAEREYKSFLETNPKDREFAAMDSLLKISSIQEDLVVLDPISKKMSDVWLALNRPRSSSEKAECCIIKSEAIGDKKPHYFLKVIHHGLDRFIVSKGDRLHLQMGQEKEILTAYASKQSSIGDIESAKIENNRQSMKDLDYTAPVAYGGGKTVRQPSFDLGQVQIFYESAAWYPLTDDQFRKFTRSRNASIVVEGKSWWTADSIEGQLDEPTIQRIARFFSE